MAVIHPSVITPSKAEIVTAWLDEQPWGGSGEVEMIGGYRYDDPAGEVGVEGLVVRRGEVLAHLPLTYRGAPLEGAEEHLVTTMDHSTLGPRWVYRAEGDPVALDCFTRALFAAQEQAEMEVHEKDGTVSHREPTVRVRHDGERSVFGAIAISQNLAEPVEGAARIVASWDGGEAVVIAAG